MKLTINNLEEAIGAVIAEELRIAHQAGKAPGEVMIHCSVAGLTASEFFEKFRINLAIAATESLIQDLGLRISHTKFNGAPCGIYSPFHMSSLEMSSVAVCC